MSAFTSAQLMSSLLRAGNLEHAVDAVERSILIGAKFGYTSYVKLLIQVAKAGDVELMLRVYTAYRFNSLPVWLL